MVGGDISAVFTAIVLVYMATVLEETRSRIQTILSINAEFDYQLERNHQWRCLVCGKFMVKKNFYVVEKEDVKAFTKESAFSLNGPNL